QRRLRGGGGRRRGAAVRWRSDLSERRSRRKSKHDQQKPFHSAHQHSPNADGAAERTTLGSRLLSVRTRDEDGGIAFQRLIRIDGLGLIGWHEVRFGGCHVFRAFDGGLKLGLGWSAAFGHEWR